MLNDEKGLFVSLHRYLVYIASNKQAKNLNTERINFLSLIDARSESTRDGESKCRLTTVEQQ